MHDLKTYTLLIILQACMGFHLGNHADCSPEISTTQKIRKQQQLQPNKSAGVCLTEQCIDYASRALSIMNTSVDPCDDFYEYSCGGWIRTQTIPEDRSNYGFHVYLETQTQQQLKVLLEADNTEEDPAAVQNARSLYRSCTDEDGIEFQGTSRLLSYLVQYGGWPLLTNSPVPGISLEDLLSRSIRDYVKAIISPYVGPDMQSPNEMIIYISQTTFGMDMGDFLVDGTDNPTVGAYRTLMRNIALKLGADPTTVDADIDDVITFEIKLANAVTDVPNQLDIDARYHKRTLREHTVRYPWMDWLSVLQEAVSGSGVTFTEDDNIIDWAATYFEKLGSILENTTTRLIRNYVVWRFIEGRLDTLPKVFRTYHQDFKQIAYGIKSSRPRWKTCITTLSVHMPYVIGRIYIQEHFDVESKSNVEEEIRYLKKAFDQKLETLTWMDDQTKILAREKLENMGSKIGYPEEIYNDTYLNHKYPFGEIVGHYFDNYASLVETNVIQAVGKLLRPVDRSEWVMSPADVNGYYSMTQNEIVILGAILQPPYYFSKLPNYVNYGSTVASILGHELSHGYDSRGRLFDKDGNLMQWWSVDVIDAFEDKAECFTDQYSQFYVPEVNMTVKGEDTLAENIADSGGLKQALRAYQLRVRDHGEEAVLPSLNLTQEQTFFLSFAQAWCSKYREEGLRWTVMTDLHSPNMYRVIGPCQNSVEFSETFGCPVGSNMNPVEKCELW